MDIGFAEDMKDLPMFKDQNEGSQASESISGSKPSVSTSQDKYKGRYTIAFSKMDNQRLLQEPLLSQESDQKPNLTEEAKQSIFDEE